jgi:hypothetical protein
MMEDQRRAVVTDLLFNSDEEPSTDEEGINNNWEIRKSDAELRDLLSSNSSEEDKEVDDKKKCIRSLCKEQSHGTKTVDELLERFYNEEDKTLIDDEDWYNKMDWQEKVVVDFEWKAAKGKQGRKGKSWWPR